MDISPTGSGSIGSFGGTRAEPREIRERPQLRQTGILQRGILAAIEVGGAFGFESADPVLLQETNNIVVWLAPHQVVAKVAIRSDSAEKVLREHHVASSIAAQGAPVGPPLVGASPQLHQGTGFTVTLWERLQRIPDDQLSAQELGLSLQQVHVAMELVDVELPDFVLWLSEARVALGDDELMAALPVEDLRVLRIAFDEWLGQLMVREMQRQPLHGEPHDGNRIVTASGVRWIDFEGACTGPLEWDLLFLPPGARRPFGEIDRKLLALLSALNSARVATWCWIQWRFPEMLAHGRHHLAEVKKYWSSAQPSW